MGPQTGGVGDPQSGGFPDKGVPRQGVSRPGGSPDQGSPRPRLAQGLPGVPVLAFLPNTWKVITLHFTRAAFLD